MILTNCRLIPELCEGFQEEMADIRVEGTDIAEILPCGGHYVGEEVVDCAGKTVLPGLMDLHSHLFFSSLAGYLTAKPESWSEGTIHTDGIQYMYKLLSYGFTTIRDAGCAFGVSLKIRDAVNEGRLTGPRIKVSGGIVCPDFKVVLPAFAQTDGIHVNGTIGVRAAIRQIAAQGVDFIKLYATDGALNGINLFTDDEMAEVERTCKHLNIDYAAHSMSSEGNWQCIEYGITTLEHGLFWNEKDTEHLVKKGYQSSLVPTFGGIEMFCESVKPGSTREVVKGYHSAYEDKNIKIGFGTDFAEDFWLAKPAREFLIREEMLGFSRIDILKQATIVSAQILKTDDICGSIKVGKKADFAVVDGKPDEDLSVFNSPCAVVIKDGKVVARDGFVMP